MSFCEPLGHCDRLPLTLSVFRKNFPRISVIGPHLYVFEPIAESTAAVPVAGPSARMQIRV